MPDRLRSPVGNSGKAELKVTDSLIDLGIVTGNEQYSLPELLSHCRMMTLFASDDGWMLLRWCRAVVYSYPRRDHWMMVRGVEKAPVLLAN
uniref:Uncharacterized protein n=1 Tax=Zea mays TaxID=4577 RepID=A0A804Q0C5_MAIZE